MNSMVAYSKKKYQFNLVIVCKEKKKRVREKERIVFYIILLGNLYYFIELYIYKINTRI